MKRLVFTEIARADLAKIRRYSTRTWGRDQTSNYSGPPYLHDGRADTLTEAIELHGGEAAASTQAFRRLPVRDRQTLLDFLGSL